MANVEPPGWPLRRLGLKVLDLQAAVNYYRGLGLTVLSQEAGGARLGFDATEVLELSRLEHGRPRPRRMAGLFHFALLLPDERALGSFLQHALSTGIPIDGASDHGVSQALYLSDPEANGIEVYADRPSQSWEWEGDRVVMFTQTLDVQALLDRAGPWAGFPADSRLGHMHLSVGNLDRSAAFYEGLGLELIRDAGIMRFLSWERYHHHLGVNLLAGAGAAPLEPDVAGLDYFEIDRPWISGDLEDPDRIKVLVARRDPAAVRRSGTGEP